MDTEERFRSVLVTANFTGRARIAIIDFCCKTLSKLAHLPRTELDTRISNLHKAQANTATSTDRVRLDATQITLLHAICLNFLDQIKCSAPLDATEITALVAEDIE